MSCQSSGGQESHTVENGARSPNLSNRKQPTQTEMQMLGALLRYQVHTGPQTWEEMSLGTLGTVSARASSADRCSNGRKRGQDTEGGLEES